MNVIHALRLLRRLVDCGAMCENDVGKLNDGCRQESRRCYAGRMDDCGTKLYADQHEALLKQAGLL
jgi:hypothetical protein